MKNLFASDRMEPYNEIGLIFNRAYFVKGLREEVNLMCNLSEGIEERAAEKAAEKTLRETNKVEYHCCGILYLMLLIPAGYIRFHILSAGKCIPFPASPYDHGCHPL